MDRTAVRDRARELPREPGVYQFLDEESVVLYVGKAVALRDRVRSYADPRSARIGRMIERADTVSVAVTDTETQALLLEANMIKRHQPPYNVRLKDDKSYPLVQLTDHSVPRIEITRDPDAAATVYGPYTDKGRVETVVKAVRELYGVRGCSDHKYANRDRPCLDHDIGLCTAPCTGEISQAAYLEDVESVKRFFEGETGVLTDPLTRAMDTASNAQQFERAANLRDRLHAVEAFHGDGGAAVSTREERTVDVLGVAIQGSTATVARLHSENGKLVDRERHTLSGAGVDASATEHPDGSAAVLSAFIPQYYAERRLPDTLLLPERPTDNDVADWLETEGVAVTIPGAGREAKLVELALKNARRGTDRTDEGALLSQALGLDSIDRIEGFDVSHAHGRAVVGSNVTFVDGQPKKSAYRRKKLTDRNDDYANMRELIGWRAERARTERDDRPEPDLLLIDGGSGQLEAAQQALAEWEWEIPCVGLAKAEETVITPNRTFDWASDAPQLHVLQRVRDEAHRFAVQYHQTLRDDIQTVLDDVPGIGPKTRANLLRRFGSVDNVRAASLTELESVPGVGTQTAETIEQRL
ncbi:excinuclease ABC subunit C [Halocatena pleomorpha]|uniref:UvrABC system protein C n=1 Tax=Halocatena pleomorpha TaxID=1785090 RepID=A0A3P3RIH0_9EURY|nr:excinuclease ABC subunit C [Halocatena pleomorpha]RRJ32203.1 excinuclease ABC subunit C [Halocatena pleomorpha]